MVDYTPVSLGDDGLAGTNSLECPECGHNHMHQMGVSVFERDAEDSETGQAVRVDYAENETVVGTDASTNNGNPSARRDGIVIKFECELCGPDDTHELVINQHKGTELVGWRE